MSSPEEMVVVYRYATGYRFRRYFRHNESGEIYCDALVYVSPEIISERDLVRAIKDTLEEAIISANIEYPDLKVYVPNDIGSEYADSMSNQICFGWRFTDKEFRAHMKEV